MNSEQRLLIKKNIDILLRHKVIIIFCILISIAGGLGYYLKLPKTYKCSSLIKYQRQSVNPTAMSPDDNRTRTRDVINTVSQQVTSRSSLEDIIRKYELYSGMQKSAPMEKIVDMMKKHHIKTRFLDGGNVFEISYIGPEQQKVMDVTNALAQSFIEENLRFRQAQASQTSTYIRDELKMAKEALDTKEMAMRDYKLRYYNEMPAQRDSNTSRLNGLQGQYQNNQDSHLELERTRLLVQEQIAARTEIISQQIIASASTSSQDNNRLNSVEQIQAKLQSLQHRYTDNHPEVKRLKKLLKNLENKKNTPEAINQTVQDPQIKELKQQLENIEFNLNRLNNERITLGKKIKQYEAWIVAAPVREAEWAALTRDYEQLNEHYQRLVTQNLRAVSAQSLEKQLQGSKFKIVDPAHFPEKPMTHDFKKILFLAIIIGSGIGVAFSYSLESLNTSFKDPADLETSIEVPVICALPVVLTKREILKKQLFTFTITSFLLLFGAAILGAVFHFWRQGMIIL